MISANRRGAALVIALVTLLAVMLIAGASVRSLVAAHRRTRTAQDEVQAQWLAEAALARALVQARSRADYAGEIWRPSISPEYAGVAEIRVERSDQSAFKIHVQAHFPDREFTYASASRVYPAAQLEAAP